MLIITAFVLGLYKNEIVANLLAIYAYWLLVVGVICLMIEYVREKKGEEDEGDGGEDTD
jgi:TM2 domain-containing membrane protein YozV